MSKNGQTQQFDKAAFKAAVEKHLTTTYANTPTTATPRSWYLAMGRALAEISTGNLLATEQKLAEDNARSVNYLSLE
ncbi:hypothetical protein, partial [Photobacterium nomapromontoriensis]